MDQNKYENSKHDDMYVARYMTERWPGKNFRREFWVSENKDDDIIGIDIVRIDAYDLLSRRLPLQIYDTKYLGTDYIWFEKFKPHEVVTTHYFYVFLNKAFIFTREEALELCNRKQYKERPGKQKGVILVDIPMFDMFSMDSYINCNDLLDNYGNSLITQRGILTH